LWDELEVHEQGDIPEWDEGVSGDERARLKV